MSLEQIHPVLITRNAGATIARTLESLADFPAVLVYDNGSSDATLEICARYGNVDLRRGDFMGFGPTKAHAVALAAGDWVLSIDADEFLSAELLGSMRAADLGDAEVAYALERRNLFMGRHVKRGGWGDDWLVRLFNRRTCNFDDSMVHEKVAVPGSARVLRLDGALWHQAVTEIDQFLEKISRYSELEVARSPRTHSPFVTCVHAFWAFTKSYFVKAGFLEGWRGLVIAVSDAVGCFYKHMKRFVNKTVPPAARRHTPE